MTVISDQNLNVMDDQEDGLAKKNLCESDHVTMEDGRRCRCLTCKPGFQAHTCNTMDPDTSFCERCPLNTYKSNVSILGQRDNCQFWRKCDQPHMVISSEGGPTYDVTCSCVGGYRLTRDSSTCIYHDPSKKIDTPMISSTKSPAKNTDNNHNTLPLSDATTPPAPWKIIAPVMAISFIALIIVIAYFLLRRKRESEKGRKGDRGHEQTHLLERNIQDITDRDLHNRVLQICRTEIGPKIGKDWKTLGTHLIQDQLVYAIHGEKDSSIEDKVSAILQTWQHSHGHTATTRVLFEALKSIKRQDIIDHLCHVVYNDPELGAHFKNEDV